MWFFSLMYFNLFYSNRTTTTTIKRDKNRNGQNRRRNSFTSRRRTEKKNEVLCMSNLSCIYETKTDNIVVVLPLTILLSFFGLQMDVIRSVEDDDYVDRPIKTMTALLLNVISPTKRNESQLRSLGLRFGCQR